MYYFRKKQKGKWISFIFASCGVLILLFGCGKALIESGDEAFQQHKYSEALRFYLEAMKENPNDNELKEKIAISYFREGEIFYEKRRVIKAFEARIKTGLKYQPENPSPELIKISSDIYLKLAQAYRYEKAENPYQKKEFFENALAYLEKSLSLDSTNTDALAALQQFKEKNFQDLLERGVNAYKKGRRDPLQYIAADHYLTNALKLDPQSEEAQKYRKLARKKSLNLLDPGLDVPLAITDQMVNSDYIAFLVTIYNLLPDNLSVNASNFYLIGDDGKEIRGKTTGMFTTPFQAQTISNGEEIGGVVAFPVDNDRQFARLEFRQGDEILGYKNLP